MKTWNCIVNKKVKYETMDTTCTKLMLLHLCSRRGGTIDRLTGRFFSGGARGAENHDVRLSLFRNLVFHLRPDCHVSVHYLLCPQCGRCTLQCMDWYTFVNTVQWHIVNNKKLHTSLMLYRIHWWNSYGGAFIVRIVQIVTISLK